MTRTVAAMLMSVLAVVANTWAAPAPLPRKAVPSHWPVGTWVWSSPGGRVTSEVTFGADHSFSGRSPGGAVMCGTWRHNGQNLSGNPCVHADYEYRYYQDEPFPGGCRFWRGASNLIDSEMPCDGPYRRQR